MPTPIRITIDDIVLKAELDDSASAQALLAILPSTLNLSRWGNEYYGNCGIKVGQDETAREIMAVGELAIWPPGNALCIFFGPTPASTDDRPRAASPVNPVGRLLSDVKPLNTLGGSITVEVRLEA